jgi:hypothetical protein
MDDGTILILVFMVLCFIAIFLYIYVKERAADRKERRQRTAAATATRTRRAYGGEGEPREELGTWLVDLMDEFGVDPDMLFDDEMPEELAGIMPLARGFVKSGGLSKLLQAPQKEAPAPDEMQI